LALGEHRLRRAARVREPGQLDRLEQRLLVLALVLDHEAEGEAAAQERVVAVERRVLERAERAVADALEVVARRGRVEERELAAARSLLRVGRVQGVAHTG